MTSVFEQCVDRIHRELADSSVQCGKFKTSINEKMSIRRVVWVPRGGSIDGPATNGGVLAACCEEEPAQPTTRRKPIYSLKQTVVARIRAESFEALECLHNNVLNATRTALGNAATPGAFLYPTQDEESGTVHAGQEYVTQAFVFDYAVFGRLVQLTTLTSHSHTDEFGDTPEESTHPEPTT